MSDDNIYENVANQYKDNPVVILLFVFSFIMLSIGIWLFVEDTYSSKIALEAIQSNYGVKVQIFDFTYWIMSLAPQVASIVFMYMFLSSDKEYKWLAFALTAQLFDFVADMYYRGNGKLFDDPAVFLISALMTFLYFSVGSEFFISVGFGLSLKLGNPALRNFKQVWRSTAATYKPSNTNRPVNKDVQAVKNTFKNNQSASRPAPKPTPTASTRPLYNEPTYHPVQSSQSSDKPARPSWLPEE